MAAKALMAIGVGTICVSGALAGPVVFSAWGVNPAAIQGTVDAFRAAISGGGGVNAPNTGPFLTGRREINWDAPGLDSVQSPALMPGDFFSNTNRRGATFSTPDGRGFLVSKRTGGALARFGDIESSLNTTFQAFSEQRLFAVADGVVCDTRFNLPVTPGAAATVNGFGVVFTDVDQEDSTRMEFYGTGDVLLRSVPVVVSPDGGLSFLGVFFGDGERVERVRIISGSEGIMPDRVDSEIRDLVAMDDFIYGEPIAVPAPASLALCGLAGAGLMHRRRR